MRDTIAAALAANVNMDGNPALRDVVVVRTAGSAAAGRCDPTVGIAGAMVVAGGVCWTHVHPDEGNVYDFTEWAGPGRHPGGRPPIATFAESAGSVELVFPSHHGMDRWHTYVNHVDRHIERVGRFGDSVAFGALPAALQTAAALAAARAGSNASVTAFDAGVEAEQGAGLPCGSAGEVANRPAFGNQYHSVTAGWDAAGLDWARLYNPETSKSNVWLNTVLHAPDQLRHRTAWALSQVFSLGSPGFGRQTDIESWATFYDIFVRNAFGNYREVLREVARSPMMGSYLTFAGNREFDIYGAQYPDENFAREIMQLFSVGLWELNEDGSAKLDPTTGAKTPTYTNDDIVTFARVWTGWDRNPSRCVAHVSHPYHRVPPLPPWATLAAAVPCRTLGVL
jgi:cullin-associated NEDD8-dissociated protein 1